VIFVALFAGLIAPSGLTITLFALCGSIAAIYGAERYRSRNAIIRASLAVGVINVVVGIAARIIDHREVSWRGLAGAAVFGLVGALITAAIASFATPLYESVFDILTDLKPLSSNAISRLPPAAIQTPAPIITVYRRHLLRSWLRRRRQSITDGVGCPITTSAN
jgi:hypothetical protein